jgi:serine/threonine protein kinase
MLGGRHAAVDPWVLHVRAQEIVEFSRKLCLSGVLMIAEAGSTTQILLGVLLSFMFTTVYIVVRPYADTNTNTFRMLVDAALFFTLQCILGIHSGFVGDCEWLSVEKVGLILIFLNVVMVALSCGLEAIARAFKIVRETQLVGIMYRPGDTVEMRSTADGPSAATSKVYHGVFKSHAKAESRPCVVKVRSLSLAVLNVEEAIMMECRHPNVVKMFQAMDDGYSHFLAMMPCECSIQMAVENGSLFSAAGQVAMDRVLNISKAVIAGVNGLHEADFVHCNIHPSNVLLSLDGVPMLSGFSTATTLNIDAFATTVNTQHTFEGYRAPEVIAGRDTSIIVELKIPQAIDTYSLGCTLFYICSNGEHAFPTDMGIDQQAAAANRIGNAQLAAEAQSVLSGMLDPNPYARPALGQVLAHPWFWTAERKVQYLGEVGNMLPVREHKSKNAFIADLEAAADEQLGEYNELEPDQGGSWARLLNPRYPLGNDGWGKQQRRPEDEERMYHVYGIPKPSKRQKQEREGLIAACKPLGTHEAKHIRMVGLLKVIRNFDAHGAQHIQAGRFESEAALHNYLIEPFPWLLMAVYCCDAKHQLTITATDQTMESERTLGLGPNETMANPMAATGGGDDLHFSSGSIMSGMTIGGGDTDDASSVASSQTTSTSGGSFAF